ncbi:hypothetical protein ACWCWD_36200 [Streptomyces sp. NPDC001493]
MIRINSGTAERSDEQPESNPVAWLRGGDPGRPKKIVNSVGARN